MQPMMIQQQQPAVVIIAEQPKTAKCDFKDCENAVTNKCFYYSYCGESGCQKNFCHEHAGKTDCLYRRSWTRRYNSYDRHHGIGHSNVHHGIGHSNVRHRVGHNHTHTVTVQGKAPTPCIDCAPQAKKISIRLYWFLALFLCCPCVLTAIIVPVYIAAASKSIRRYNVPISKRRF